MRFHRPFKMLVAICTSVTFFATSLGVSPGAFAAPATPVAAEVSLPYQIAIDRDLSFAIPQELGKLERFNPGAGGQPAIFHIQTAHGHYEAQQQVRKILHYLGQQYGVTTVLVEGSAFQLDPKLLNFFPKDPKLTQKINDELTKRALVKGPELYLLDQLQDIGGRISEGVKRQDGGGRKAEGVKEQDIGERRADGEKSDTPSSILHPFPEPAAQALGIEHLDSYRENGKAFVEVLQQKEKTTRFLDDMDLQIDRLASRMLNKDLRDFLRRVDSFEKNRIPLDVWLKDLKGEVQKSLEIDLASPAEQLDWPMMVRFFKMQELAAKLNLQKFPKEREAFLKAVKRFLPVSLYGEIERFLMSDQMSRQLSDPETELLFEDMVKQLPENFNYDAFPNVRLFVGSLLLQSELKADRLFAETKALSSKIADKLTRNQGEKQLAALLADHRLLQKLFALELMPEDYELIVGGRKAEGGGSLKPSEIVKRFESAILHPSSSIRQVRSVQFSHLEELDSLYEKAMKFYAGVRERDGAMEQRIEERLRETGANKVAVITGGFHARPFGDYFSSRNCTYALISPKLTSTDDAGHAAYESNMIRFAYGGGRMEQIQKQGNVERTAKEQTPSAILHPVIAAQSAATREFEFLSDPQVLSGAYAIHADAMRAEVREVIQEVAGRETISLDNKAVSFRSEARDLPPPKTVADIFSLAKAGDYEAFTWLARIAYDYGGSIDRSMESYFASFKRFSEEPDRRVSKAVQEALKRSTNKAKVPEIFLTTVEKIFVGRSDRGFWSLTEEVKADPGQFVRDPVIHNLILGFFASASAGDSAAKRGAAREVLELLRRAFWEQSDAKSSAQKSTDARSEVRVSDSEESTVTGQELYMAFFSRDKLSGLEHSLPARTLFVEDLKKIAFDLAIAEYDVHKNITEEAIREFFSRSEHPDMVEYFLNVRRAVIAARKVRKASKLPDSPFWIRQSPADSVTTNASDSWLERSRLLFLGSGLAMSFRAEMINPQLMWQEYFFGDLLSVRRSLSAQKWGDLGDLRAMPLLVRALREVDGYFVSTAATALGKLRAFGAVPALVKTFELWRRMPGDESSRVCAALAEALGEIGEPLAIPALEKAREDEHELVRVAVERALEKIRNASSAPGEGRRSGGLLNPADPNNPQPAVDEPLRSKVLEAFEWGDRPFFPLVFGWDLYWGHTEETLVDALWGGFVSGLELFYHPLISYVHQVFSLSFYGEEGDEARRSESRSRLRTESGEATVRAEMRLNPVDPSILRPSKTGVYRVGKLEFRPPKTVADIFWWAKEGDREALAILALIAQYYGGSITPEMRRFFVLETSTVEEKSRKIANQALRALKNPHNTAIVTEDFFEIARKTLEARTYSGFWRLRAGVRDHPERFVPDPAVYELVHHFFTSTLSDENKVVGGVSVEILRVLEAAAAEYAAQKSSPARSETRTVGRWVRSGVVFVALAAMLGLAACGSKPSGAPGIQQIPPPGLTQADIRKSLEVRPPVMPQDIKPPTFHPPAPKFTPPKIHPFSRRSEVRDMTPLATVPDIFRLVVNAYAHGAFSLLAQGAKDYAGSIHRSMHLFFMMKARSSDPVVRRIATVALKMLKQPDSSSQAPESFLLTVGKIFNARSFIGFWELAEEVAADLGQFVRDRAILGLIHGFFEITATANNAGVRRASDKVLTLLREAASANPALKLSIARSEIRNLPPPKTVPDIFRWAKAGDRGALDLLAQMARDYGGSIDDSMKSFFVKLGSSNYANFRKISDEALEALKQPTNQARVSGDFLATVETIFGARSIRGFWNLTERVKADPVKFVRDPAVYGLIRGFFLEAASASEADIRRAADEILDLLKATAEANSVQPAVDGDRRSEMRDLTPIRTVGDIFELAKGIDSEAFSVMALIAQYYGGSINNAMKAFFVAKANSSDKTVLRIANGALNALQRPDNKAKVPAIFLDWVNKTFKAQSHDDFMRLAREVESTAAWLVYDRPIHGVIHSYFSLKAISPDATFRKTSDQVLASLRFAARKMNEAKKSSDARSETRGVARWVQRGLVFVVLAAVLGLAACALPPSQAPPPVYTPPPKVILPTPELPKQFKLPQHPSVPRRSEIRSGPTLLDLALGGVCTLLLLGSILAFNPFSQEPKSKGSEIGQAPMEEKFSISSQAADEQRSQAARAATKASREGHFVAVMWSTHAAVEWKGAKPVQLESQTGKIVLWKGKVLLTTQDGQMFSIPLASVLDITISESPSGKSNRSEVRTRAERTDEKILETEGRLPWENAMYREVIAKTKPQNDGLENPDHVEQIDFVGQSEAISKVFGLLKRYAASPLRTPLIVSGKSGTGKELAWKLVHYLSPRKNNPPVVVDINILNGAQDLNVVLYGTREAPGLLEQARNSTLVLDGVEDATPRVQGALLRVLESRKITRSDFSGPVDLGNIQIVVTKNKEFPIKAGYREDLIRRFKARLDLPPLDERDGDWPLLFEFYNYTMSRALEIPWRPLSLRSGLLLMRAGLANEGEIRGIQEIVEKVLVQRMEADPTDAMFTTPEEIKNAGFQKNMYVGDTVDTNGILVSMNLRSGEEDYLSLVRGERPYFSLSTDPDNFPVKIPSVSREEAEKHVAALNLWLNDYANLKRLGASFVVLKGESEPFQLKGLQWLLGDPLRNGEYELSLQMRFSEEGGETEREVTAGPLVTGFPKGMASLWDLLMTWLRQHELHKDYWGEPREIIYKMHEAQAVAFAQSDLLFKLDSRREFVKNLYNKSMFDTLSAELGERASNLHGDGRVVLILEGSSQYASTAKDRLEALGYRVAVDDKARFHLDELQGRAGYNNYVLILASNEFGNKLDFLGDKVIAVADGVKDEGRVRQRFSGAAGVVAREKIGTPAFWELVEKVDPAASATRSETRTEEVMPVLRELMDQPYGYRDYMNEIVLRSGGFRRLFPTAEIASDDGKIVIQYDSSSRDAEHDPQLEGNAFANLVNYARIGWWATSVLPKDVVTDPSDQKSTWQIVMTPRSEVRKIVAGSRGLVPSSVRGVQWIKDMPFDQMPQLNGYQLQTMSKEQFDAMTLEQLSALTVAQMNVISKAKKQWGWFQARSMKLSKLQAEARSQAASEGDGGSRSEVREIEKLSPSTAPEADPVAQTVGAEIRQVRKILVIDDEYAIRGLYKIHFEGAGYEVVVAENGQLALELLDQQDHQKRPFDLVITDDRMPVMNGAAFARAFRIRERREQSGKEKTPVIMMTGDEADETQYSEVFGLQLQGVLDGVKRKSSSLMTAAPLLDLVAQVKRMHLAAISEAAFSKITQELETTPSAAPPDPASSNVIRILFADDEGMIRAMFSTFLDVLNDGRWKLEIDAVESGEKALEAIEEKGVDYYDGVILDGDFNASRKLNGMEVGKKLREEQMYEGLLILASEAPHEGGEKWFSTEIRKPFEGKDLRELILESLVTQKERQLAVAATQSRSESRSRLRTESGEATVRAEVRLSATVRDLVNDANVRTAAELYLMAYDLNVYNTSRNVSFHTGVRISSEERQRTDEASEGLSSARTALADAILKRIGTLGFDKIVKLAKTREGHFNILRSSLVEPLFHPTTKWSGLKRQNTNLIWEEVNNLATELNISRHRSEMRESTEEGVRENIGAWRRLRRLGSLGALIVGGPMLVVLWKLDIQGVLRVLLRMTLSSHEWISSRAKKALAKNPSGLIWVLDKTDLEDTLFDAAAALALSGKGVSLITFVEVIGAVLHRDVRKLPRFQTAFKEVWGRVRSDHVEDIEHFVQMLIDAQKKHQKDHDSSSESWARHQAKIKLLGTALQPLSDRSEQIHRSEVRQSGETFEALRKGSDLETGEGHAPVAGNSRKIASFAAMMPSDIRAKFRAMDASRIGAIFAKTQASAVAATFRAMHHLKIGAMFEAMDVSRIGAMFKAMDAPKIGAMFGAMSKDKIAAMSGAMNASRIGAMFREMDASRIAAMFGAMNAFGIAAMFDVMGKDEIAAMFKAMDAAKIGALFGAMEKAGITAMFRAMDAARIGAMFREMDASMIGAMVKAMDPEKIGAMFKGMDATKIGAMFKVMDKQGIGVMFWAMDVSRLAMMFRTMNKFEITAMFVAMDPDKIDAMSGAMSVSKITGMFEAMNTLGITAMFRAMSQDKVAAMFRRMNKHEISAMFRAMDQDNIAAMFREMDVSMIGAMFRGMDEFKTGAMFGAMDQGKIVAMFGSMSQNKIAAMFRKMNESETSAMFKAMDTEKIGAMFRTMGKDKIVAMFRAMRQADIVAMFGAMDKDGIVAMFRAMGQEKIIAMFRGMDAPKIGAMFRGMDAPKIAAMFRALDKDMIGAVFGAMDQNEIAAMFEAMNQSKIVAMFKAMDTLKLAAMFGAMDVSRIAAMFKAMDAAKIGAMFRTMNRSRIAAMFRALDKDAIVAMLGTMGQEKIVAMFSAMDKDKIVAMFGAMDQEKIAAMFGAMDDAVIAALRQGRMLARFWQRIDKAMAGYVSLQSSPTSRSDVRGQSSDDGRRMVEGGKRQDAGGRVADGEKPETSSSIHHPPSAAKAARAEVRTADSFEVAPAEISQLKEVLALHNEKWAANHNNHMVFKEKVMRNLIQKGRVYLLRDKKGDQTVRGVLLTHPMKTGGDMAVIQKAPLWKNMMEGRTSEGAQDTVFFWGISVADSRVVPGVNLGQIFAKQAVRHFLKDYTYVRTFSPVLEKDYNEFIKKLEQEELVPHTIKKYGIYLYLASAIGEGPWSFVDHIHRTHFVAPEEFFKSTQRRFRDPTENFHVGKNGAKILGVLPQEKGFTRPDGPFTAIYGYGPGESDENFKQLSRVPLPGSTYRALSDGSVSRSKQKTMFQKIGDTVLQGIVFGAGFVGLHWLRIFSGHGGPGVQKKLLGWTYSSSAALSRRAADALLENPAGLESLLAEKDLKDEIFDVAAALILSWGISDRTVIERVLLGLSARDLTKLPRLNSVFPGFWYRVPESDVSFWEEFLGKQLAEENNKLEQAGDVVWLAWRVQRKIKLLEEALNFVSMRASAIQQHRSEVRTGDGEPLSQTFEATAGSFLDGVRVGKRSLRELSTIEDSPTQFVIHIRVDNKKSGADEAPAFINIDQVTFVLSVIQNRMGRAHYWGAISEKDVASEGDRPGAKIFSLEFQKLPKLLPAPSRSEVRGDQTPDLGQETAATASNALRRTQDAVRGQSVVRSLSSVVSAKAARSEVRLAGDSTFPDVSPERAMQEMSRVAVERVTRWFRAGILPLRVMLGISREEALAIMARLGIHQETAVKLADHLMPEDVRLLEKIGARSLAVSHGMNDKVLAGGVVFMDAEGLMNFAKNDSLGFYNMLSELAGERLSERPILTAGDAGTMNRIAQVLLNKNSGLAVDKAQMLRLLSQVIKVEPLRGSQGATINGLAEARHGGMVTILSSEEMLAGLHDGANFAFKDRLAKENVRLVLRTLLGRMRVLAAQLDGASAVDRVKLLEEFNARQVGGLKKISGGFVFDNILQLVQSFLAQETAVGKSA